jgi:hypothetical protein
MAFRRVYMVGSWVTCTLITAGALAATNQPRGASATFALREGSVVSFARTATVTESASPSGTSSDIVFAMVPRVGEPLLPWIEATVSGHASKKALQFLTLDALSKITDVEALPDATIAEIDFPELVAGSKNSSVWSVKLHGTHATHAPGDHSALVPPPVPTPDKRMLDGNFRLAIDGLDCTHTKKVSAITVKSVLAPEPAPARSIVRNPLLRAPVIATKGVPTSTATVSNVSVTVSLTHGGQGFQQWLSGGRVPKSGTLTVIAPDMQTVLCTIALNSVGIAQVVVTSSTDDVRADLTVGGMRLACPGL